MTFNEEYEAVLQEVNDVVERYLPEEVWPPAKQAVKEDDFAYPMNPPALLDVSSFRSAIISAAFFGADST